MDKAAVEEVDAMKEMERAKVELKEREERKAVTKGAGEVPVAPKMTLNVSLTQRSYVCTLIAYVG